MVLALILLTRLGRYRYGVEAESHQAIEAVQIASGA
jgi:hypothetical protein